MKSLVLWGSLSELAGKLILKIHRLFGADITSAALSNAPSLSHCRGQPFLKVTSSEALIYGAARSTRDPKSGREKSARFDVGSTFLEPLLEPNGPAIVTKPFLLARQRRGVEKRGGG